MKDVYIKDSFRHFTIMLMIISCALIAAVSAASFFIGAFRIIAAVSAVSFALTLYYGFRKVYSEQKRTDKLLRLYTEGYTDNETLNTEIRISPEIRDVFMILEERIDRDSQLNASMKQAQYLALQNQINPHFLYNTLESIRGEALMAGIDGVASMTEALSTFFRYTISNVDHLVTLEDELSNIENYYVIQQYRFGDKLGLSIDYDDDDDMSVLNLKVPKLILQPLVENSIYHGIERKTGRGELKIKIENTRERLIIKVSDDGIGMSPEILDALNERLITNSPESIKTDQHDDGHEHSGIAIINVNNRIRLLFGDRYGIYIYSTEGVGTDVEMTLPVIADVKA